MRVENLRRRGRPSIGSNDKKAGIHKEKQEHDEARKELLMQLERAHNKTLKQQGIQDEKQQRACVLDFVKKNDLFTNLKKS